jgi:hypothetical protein
MFVRLLMNDAFNDLRPSFDTYTPKPLVYYTSHMFIMKKILISALLLLVSASASSEVLKAFKITLKTGNWSVHRSIDPMTDAVECTGFLQGSPGVQLTRVYLFVKIPGGIKTITLRFDDQPAYSTRLSSEREKSLNAIVINSIDLEQARKSSRLRVQSLTSINGVVNEDFDLTGIQAASDHILAGCPISEQTPQQEVAPIQSTEQKEEFVCTSQTISRLRAAKVSEKQIKSVCKT